MITLLFATNNANKVQEVKLALNNQFEIITLKDAGIDIDIPEPHPTIEQNASEKSRTINNLTKKNCFSEDTGLFVHELNGEPGVKSARYAAENKNFTTNIDLLLANLKDKKNRNAYFRTVFSLVLNDHEHFFEGVCEGNITEKPKGSNGFGYDSVFKPIGSDKTFAEMTIEEKANYSHRKKGLDKLVAFLLNI